MSQRSEEIARNLSEVKARIEKAAQDSSRASSDIKLIVVTKTFPVSDIEILYDLGIRDFGENRDQEASAKAPLISKDVTWHFQGQIQSNKLKSIGSWAQVIHSLDDITHAKILDSKHPGKAVLAQISLDQGLGNVKNRGGVAPANLKEFVTQIKEQTSLELLGFMAVAPLDEDPLTAFSRLREIASDYSDLPIISAGMSHDFEAAISQGATHLRIGSQILGVR